MTKSKSALAEQPFNEIAAPQDESIEEKNALSLLPRSGGVLSTRDRLLRLTTILETPYVSGSALAQVETIVTVLNVGEGQVEDLNEPGNMKNQYIYLCMLQTPISYRTKAGEVVEKGVGDLVKIGLEKFETTGPRDDWATILRESTDMGEALPDIMLRQLPPKKPGLNGAVVFRQLTENQVTKLVN